MNGKKAKALRRAAKQNGNLDLRNPDYRVSKEKKKIVYETKMVEGLPKTEAKTITMQSIVNLNKVRYRQFKKMFKTIPRTMRDMFKA